MNRFNIRPGKERAFEEVWKSRDSHLNGQRGFKEFHLLKGPDRRDHTLRSSHTVWHSQQHFENWTQSDAFKKAHRNAGSHGELYSEHPLFEVFEVVQALSTEDNA